MILMLMFVNVLTIIKSHRKNTHVDDCLDIKIFDKHFRISQKLRICCVVVHISAYNPGNCCYFFSTEIPVLNRTESQDFKT